MAKTGTYVHRVVRNSLNIEFSNAYGTDKYIEINLNDAVPGIGSSHLYNKRNFSGNIQLVRLTGTKSGGATSIVLKGYEDSNGTDLLLPPSVSPLEPGITGTEDNVVFYVNVFNEGTHDKLYLFCKTDTGTFTVSEAQVVWFE